MPPDRTQMSSDAATPRRGAEILLEVLRDEGVTHIFGNPGTTELPLMDALVGARDISYVLGLQEASCVAMADGYAKATGRAAFLNLHTAGGLGHAMGAIINAQVAGTPLVVTAGQQDTRHRLADPLLHGDLVRIATPAVKWAEEVVDVEQIPVLLRRAFQDAQAPPQGPVFLSLPMDIMGRESAVKLPPRSFVDRAPVGGSLQTLATALAGITPGRVAIIAGDEVLTSDAGDEVARIAELLGAPVFGSSWPAFIPFATDHPHWVGTLPTVASDMRERLSRFEAVLALGGKSAIAILYSEGPALPPHCRLYQISTDVRDLGRTHATPLSIVGDIRASLRALEPMLAEAMRPHREGIAAVRRNLVTDREARQTAFAARYAEERGEAVITPFVAAYAVLRAITPDVPIIDEAPATMPHVRALLASPSSRQYASCRGGGLGWGMPAAIGYSLGLDRGPVVSLVGDGAAMYSPQALWTAARENLPVTFVVLNNRRYGILKDFLRNQPEYLSSRENRFVAMDLDDPPIDYIALARSMGVAASQVTREAEIGAAVEQAIASRRPNLVEIVIQ